MEIKVLTTRKFKKGTIEEAHRTLMQLRAVATVRQGYVSGLTLVSADDPYTLLVISSWTDKRGWDLWQASEKRREISKKIGGLLEAPEHVAIFYVGHEESDGADMA